MDSSDDAATKVQSLVRRFFVRRDMFAYLSSNYGRFWDEHAGLDYYVNLATWESSWERPPCLGSAELPYYDAGDESKRLESLEDLAFPEEEEKKDEQPLDWGEGESEEKWQDDEAEQVMLDESLLNALKKDEPKPAPPPATLSKTISCWETIVPPEENPNHAILRRIDVYTSKSPQKCLLLRDESVESALKRSDLWNTENRSITWSLTLSFFAYDAPVSDSVKYSVWSRKKPWRSRVSFEMPGQHQKEEENITDTESEDEGTDLGNAFAIKEEEWEWNFDFWAFYAPVQNSIRVNVQYVPNPIRYKVTEQPSLRGGWSQCFSFFAYPTTRLAVFDTVNCERDVMRSKIREMPLEEDGRLHPPIEDIEMDGEQDPSQTWWCRRFEFFGFKCRFAGTVEYKVFFRYELLRESARKVRTGGIPVYEMEKVVFYPAYKLVQEGKGDTNGWTLVSSFFAFPIPIPLTTRFYFKVCRRVDRPSRFRITMNDFCGKDWDTLFSFYAYSTRSVDWHRVEYHDGQQTFVIVK